MKDLLIELVPHFITSAVFWFIAYWVIAVPRNMKIWRLKKIILGSHDELLKAIESSSFDEISGIKERMINYYRGEIVEVYGLQNSVYVITERSGVSKTVQNFAIECLKEAILDFPAEFFSKRFVTTLMNQADNVRASRQLLFDAFTGNITKMRIFVDKVNAYLDEVEQNKTEFTGEDREYRIKNRLKIVEDSKIYIQNYWR